MAGTYEIEAQPELTKQLRGIPQHEQSRIIAKIEALATDPPSGVEKLSGVEGWRIRIGDYRIVYTIDDVKKVITITRVGRRGSIYRRR